MTSSAQGDIHGTPEPSKVSKTESHGCDPVKFGWLLN
jgi:hypothetical protein